MEKNILCPAFNESLFRKGQIVGVALSGGKDSVCLLDLLLAEKEKLGIGVVCVNVDHGIRGENSAKDSLFVKELCERKGVPLFFGKSIVPPIAGNIKRVSKKGRGSCVTAFSPRRSKAVSATSSQRRIIGPTMRKPFFFACSGEADPPGFAV